MPGITLWTDTPPGCQISLSYSWRRYIIDWSTSFTGPINLLRNEPQQTVILVRHWFLISCISCERGFFRKNYFVWVIHSYMKCFCDIKAKFKYFTIWFVIKNRPFEHFFKTYTKIDVLKRGLQNNEIHSYLHEDFLEVLFSYVQEYVLKQLLCLLMARVSYVSSMNMNQANNIRYFCSVKYTILKKMS